MKLVLATFAVLLGTSATLAQSDGAAFDWSGFYAGANMGPGVLIANQPFGDQLGYFDGTDGHGGNDTLVRGGFGVGAGVGANVQMGSMVFGLDADLNVTSLTAQGSTDVDVVGRSDIYSVTTDWKWYSTLRAKLGFAADNWLAYATAGVAAVNVNYNFCYYVDFCPDAPYDILTNQTLAGLAVGAGVEVAMTETVSLKGEVLYIALPEITTGTPSNIWDGTDTTAQFSSSAVLARFGANFHFN